MKHDEHPEYETEAKFLRLMPKHPLCNQCTGPTAHQSEQVEAALWDTAAASLGTSLIDPIGYECSEAREGDDD
jgi:L-alanine-DL-glutamate epimerase-like enolase superfamily enzyme